MSYCEHLLSFSPNLCNYCKCFRNVIYCLFDIIISKIDSLSKILTAIHRNDDFQEIYSEIHIFKKWSISQIICISLSLIFIVFLKFITDCLCNYIIINRNADSQEISSEMHKTSIWSLIIIVCIIIVLISILVSFLSS